LRIHGPSPVRDESQVRVRLCANSSSLTRNQHREGGDRFGRDVASVNSSKSDGPRLGDTGAIAHIFPSPPPAVRRPSHGYSRPVLLRSLAGSVARTVVDDDDADCPGLVLRDQRRHRRRKTRPHLARASTSRPTATHRDRPGRHPHVGAPVEAASAPATPTGERARQLSASILPSAACMLAPRCDLVTRCGISIPVMVLSGITVPFWRLRMQACPVTDPPPVTFAVLPPRCRQSLLQCSWSRSSPRPGELFTPARARRPGSDAYLPSASIFRDQGRTWTAVAKSGVFVVRAHALASAFPLARSPRYLLRSLPGSFRASRRRPPRGSTSVSRLSSPARRSPRHPASGASCVLACAAPLSRHRLRGSDRERPHYHWLFWLPMILIIVAAVASLVFVPESPVPHTRPDQLDPPPGPRWPRRAAGRAHRRPGGGLGSPCGSSACWSPRVVLAGRVSSSERPCPPPLIDPCGENF